MGLCKVSLRGCHMNKPDYRVVLFKYSMKLCFFCSCFNYAICTLPLLGMPRVRFWFYFTNPLFKKKSRSLCLLLTFSKSWGLPTCLPFIFQTIVPGGSSKNVSSSLNASHCRLIWSPVCQFVSLIEIAFIFAFIKGTYRLWFWFYPRLPSSRQRILAVRTSAQWETFEFGALFAIKYILVDPLFELVFKGIFWADLVALQTEKVVMSPFCKLVRHLNLIDFPSAWVLTEKSSNLEEVLGKIDNIYLLVDTL